VKLGMEIEPIRTHRDYRRTLEEIEGLMHAKRNTPAGDRLDLLVTLVEVWETKRYPLGLPTPWKRSNTTWSRTGSRRAT
jgi:HTH-type transcriptional regulator/antitoxin HigA